MEDKGGGGYLCSMSSIRYSVQKVKRVKILSTKGIILGLLFSNLYIYLYWSTIEFYVKKLRISPRRRRIQPHKFKISSYGCEAKIWYKYQEFEAN